MVPFMEAFIPSPSFLVMELVKKWQMQSKLSLGSVSLSLSLIPRAAHVPIEWEQFDLTGYTDNKDDTLIKQAMASIRKNRVALKGKKKS